MQQTVREVRVSEVQHPLLLLDVLSIGGELVRPHINRHFSWCFISRNTINARKASIVTKSGQTSRLLLQRLPKKGSE